MQPQDVVAQDEFANVLHSHMCVLVDVHAESWCAPCRVLSSVIAKMAMEPSNASIFFVKIDADKAEPALMTGLSITAYPTVLLYINGVSSGRVVGANAIAVRQLADKGRAAVAVAPIGPIDPRDSRDRSLQAPLEPPPLEPQPAGGRWWS